LRQAKIYVFLIGHFSQIHCFWVEGSVLFSGSNDGKIKFWNFKSGSCLANFVGHSKPIRQLRVQDGVLYSASADGTIRAWNVKTQVMPHRLSDILTKSRHRSATEFQLRSKMDKNDSSEKIIKSARNYKASSSAALSTEETNDFTDDDNVSVDEFIVQNVRRLELSEPVNDGVYSSEKDTTASLVNENTDFLALPRSKSMESLLLTDQNGPRVGEMKQPKSTNNIAVPNATRKRRKSIFALIIRNFNSQRIEDMSTIPATKEDK